MVGYLIGCCIAIVVVTELRITDRKRTIRSAAITVFFPQELLCNTYTPKLLVDILIVRKLIHVLREHLLREEHAVNDIIVKVSDVFK